MDVEEQGIPDLLNKKLRPPRQKRQLHPSASNTVQSNEEARSAVDQCFYNEKHPNRWFLVFGFVFDFDVLVDRDSWPTTPLLVSTTQDLHFSTLRSLVPVKGQEAAKFSA